MAQTCVYDLLFPTTFQRYLKTPPFSPVANLGFEIQGMPSNQKSIIQYERYNTTQKFGNPFIEGEKKRRHGNPIRYMLNHKSQPPTSSICLYSQYSPEMPRCSGGKPAGAPDCLVVSGTWNPSRRRSRAGGQRQWRGVAGSPRRPVRSTGLRLDGGYGAARWPGRAVSTGRRGGEQSRGAEQPSREEGRKPRWGEKE